MGIARIRSDVFGIDGIPPAQLQSAAVEGLCVPALPREEVSHHSHSQSHALKSSIGVLPVPPPRPPRPPLNTWENIDKFRS